MYQTILRHKKYPVMHFSYLKINKFSNTFFIETNHGTKKSLIFFQASIIFLDLDGILYWCCSNQLEIFEGLLFHFGSLLEETKVPLKFETVSACLLF